MRNNNNDNVMTVIMAWVGAVLSILLTIKWIFF